MGWEKRGLIYVPGHQSDWMVSHASVPVVDKVNEEVLRIYFSVRDGQNRSRPTYIEVKADDPVQICYRHEQPVLGLGALGSFDDAGVVPSWIVTHAGVKYLYYIGWNEGKSVPYRNAIGLAASHDGGRSFTRMFEGPILDRTRHEPHFCASSCVLVEEGRWRIWYLSCVQWTRVDHRSEPRYHIKYAESSNGIDWDRQGIVCIDFKSPVEGGIARPCVVKDGDRYLMWYAYRNLHGYHSQREASYRIGYAESGDGISWERRDDQVDLDVSDDGWDSQMIEYPYVYEHKGQRFMVYNGNGFGASGFGYAVWTP